MKIPYNADAEVVGLNKASFGFDYEAKTDVAERGEQLLEELIKEKDLKIADKPVTFVAQPNCKWVCKRTMAACASIPTAMDNGVACDFREYIVFLSEDLYMRYGWDWYEGIVRHEIAHAEADERTGFKVTDGDLQFNAVCEWLGGYLDGDEAAAYKQELAEKIEDYDANEYVAAMTATVK